jgi:hypothetical protein
MVARRAASGRKKSGSQKSANGKRRRHDDGEAGNDGDYDVGFGKPPKYTRFKQGVSGNPKGRPKWKAQGMLTAMIGKELYRPIRINQNGETTSMPALQVALRRLVRMGAEGSAKAVEAMLKIAADHSQTVAEDQNDEISQMTPEERASRIIEILESAKRRKLIREAKKTTDGDG